MSSAPQVDVIREFRPRISENLNRLPSSGIREFFDLVIGRNDIISLGVGEPDWATAAPACEAAIHAIEAGDTSYTSNQGLLSLRESIVRYLSERFSSDFCPASEVLITVGASQAMDLALRAILNPGDEVIFVEPCYVAYEPLIRLAGGVPISLETSREDGFRVDPAKLEELITSQTRAIIVNYPSNPTGTTLDSGDIRQIVELANRHDLLVISDEIYAELTYGRDHVSMASVEGSEDRVLVLSGFSKAFAMTGWRIGYAAGPKDVIAAMTKIHQYSMLCAPIISQRAAEAALRNGLPSMHEMVSSLQKRGESFVNGLRQIGLPVADSQGAFYAFPSIAHLGLSSVEFCSRLLEEESIAVVPGTAFGECGEGHIRAAYCASEKILNRALEGIDRFVKRLS